jgi:peptidyl-prolyl cis-trans isomerase SurA
VLALCLALPAPAQVRQAVRNGDYIVAVINQELVTAGEVDRRIDQAQAQAAQRPGLKLPPRPNCASRRWTG